ncbi:MAG: cytidine deaminase [Bacteroidales bacterium]|nr:cytidine deaminase [Bacteroidales bacterium]
MDCTLVIHYVHHEFSEEALGKDNFNLAQQARQATFTAYSPYSHFCVGAAVLLDNGDTVCGSNQENAAFGAGTCAERTALFYAHAHQPDVPVAAIAIAARKEGEDFTLTPISPCGICRQALVEAETRAGHPIRVLLCGRNEVWEFATVKDILPFTFESF